MDTGQMDKKHFKTLSIYDNVRSQGNEGEVKSGTKTNESRIKKTKIKSTQKSYILYTVKQQRYNKNNISR